MLFSKEANCEESVPQRDELKRCLVPNEGGNSTADVPRRMEILMWHLFSQKVGQNVEVTFTHQLMKIAYAFEEMSKAYVHKGTYA